MVPFIENKFAFVQKWEKARLEKKLFKPAQKAIDKYETGGDITSDITDEKLTEVREVYEKKLEIIKKGSFYPEISFMDALYKIWDPETYDVDGNKGEISFVKKVQPRPKVV